MRKQVFDFLQFNQTEELKLMGGCIDKVKIDTLHLGAHTRFLILKDMLSIQMNEFFENLPELVHLDIRNVDEFKK